ncbi:MAG: hypothetical protein K9L60_01260 [Methylovulum sp.]|nr:hypothetical protein [Methylovulum sp.]MCF7997735.1 hypothetical protein [Methylovulum sp.]
MITVKKVLGLPNGRSADSLLGVVLVQYGRATNITRTEKIYPPQTVNHIRVSRKLISRIRTTLSALNAV